jgi:hypothetical protein
VSWPNGMPPRAAPGWQGTACTEGGNLPRPTGDSPPGAALPPVGILATGAGSTAAKAPPGDRARRTGRAVLLTPGILSPRKITVKGARCARVGCSATADP